MLLISLAVAAVLRAGADAFYENDATRLTVTLLMLAALMVLAGFGMRPQGLARKPGSPLDERDVAILDRAPLLEGNAMMVTLALWVVGLQQTFWSAGAVPLVWQRHEKSIKNFLKRFVLFTRPLESSNPFFNQHIRIY